MLDHGPVNNDRLCKHPAVVKTGIPADHLALLQINLQIFI